MQRSAVLGKFVVARLRCLLHLGGAVASGIPILRCNEEKNITNTTTAIVLTTYAETWGFSLTLQWGNIFGVLAGTTT